jgi:hypothetical protein
VGDPPNAGDRRGAQACSNHWRTLREAGLILMTVDGRHRRIRPRADDLSDRFPGLLDPILRLGTAESLNSGLL